MSESLLCCVPKIKKPMRPFERAVLTVAITLLMISVAAAANAEV
jgi:hypothetical protein